MTNFEYMKEMVLNIVAALDEAELRQLVIDTGIDEGGNKDIFSCAYCEEVFGNCDTVPNENGCMERYLYWCNKEYNPKLVWEDKIDIVDRLSDLLKATRIGSDIDKLILSEDKHIVTIKYRHGAEKHVNIECNSGYAIITDVLAALR